ncbi:MAG: acylphosphatase [Candidatus Marinimicrobia bacterium]|nr:acylphosphatase [Candidatus Neomarinimicrobiota bacterium]|tara:strand:+ start:34464 stop:34748 length:285 start_codon:yes stop_codon:yes gene_type:complete
MKSQEQSISFRVTGKVQGVWFRAFTQDKASLKNVTGWVKNESDGSVIGEAEGVNSKIEEFISLLEKGSPNSNVEHVDIEVSSDLKGYNDFHIRH